MLGILKEYEELGHLERVVESSEPPTHYYIPHHGVLRPEKLTTKLRIVFNGSSPDGAPNRQSLNDILLKESFSRAFADASEAAYGAVVYLQCFLHNGAAKVSILARVLHQSYFHTSTRALCLCFISSTRQENTLHLD
ncbi:DUF1758 domain-containing protein [Trichonephila clavipes]|nr:DUF1758 domain-containing protein [Trichonephila clavipes]